MRLLVVEDDMKIGSFLRRGLGEAGFAVDLAADGEQGLCFFEEHPGYDAAVIDLMLPGMDGLTLIETIRAREITTPILILSARRTVDDRVRGLQQGGDDYMVKPFSFAELLARIQALIRRDSRSRTPSSLSAGDLHMDLLARRVERGGREIGLTAREFALLEYMLRNRGRLLSKTSILEHIYDYSFDPQTNVVDVLVCRLRNKIDKGFDDKLIHTVRGMGYVLRTP